MEIEYEGGRINMLNSEVAERLLFIGMDEELKKKAFLLKNLLEDIAQKLGGEVFPAIQIVEGKKFLDYEIRVKARTALFLRLITIARAYFLHGFSGDDGKWTDLRVAFREDRCPQSIFSQLEVEMNKETVDRHPIKVEYVDYKKDQKEGFFRKL